MSDRVESDLRFRGERVELVSKKSFSLISLVMLGSSIWPRLPTGLLTTLLRLAEDASGLLGLARWLSKPPEPLAMQTWEPKMKVVPG